MFTEKIVESDAFTEMPLSTQALYFHLNMEADDDGFVNNPKRISRSLGASEDDLKLLIAKRFVLPFESGIIAIKHWKMHNLLRKDRYTETQYKEEKNMLMLKENGAYTELGNQMATAWQPSGNQMATAWQPSGNQMATAWQPSGNQVATKYSKEEYSKEEIRVVESSVNGNQDTNTDNPKTVENSVDNVDNSPLEYMGGKLGKGVVLLTDAQRDALFEKLGFDAFNHYVDKLSTFIITKNAKVGNHYQTILKWAQEDKRI